MKELVAAAGQPGTVSGRDAVARSGTRYTGGLQGKKAKKQRVSGIFRRRRPGPGESFPVCSLHPHVLFYLS